MNCLLDTHAFLWVVTATFHRLPKFGHKDPFDRMIIWQAIQQSLVLISKDAGFPEYRKSGLQVMW